MESYDIDRETAAAQLDALRGDRAALADRVVQPWWYDALLGLLLFGFLSSRALGSTWVSGIALVLFLAGLGGLVALYRRMTGVWVNTPPKVMGAWALVVIAVLVPAFLLEEDHPWVMVVAGAVLGGTVVLLSRRWGRAFAAELRDGEL